jgi:DNA-binding HxlR family transcriptional regulator
MMWTPANAELLNVIVEEIEKRGPCRFNTLWEVLQDRFGSKTTFNVYLQALVKQGIIKRYGHRMLPGGRWRTVKRGPHVKYSLAKTSPLSAEAPKERLGEWVEENLRRSNLDLLTAVEQCLEGDGGWKELYGYFEKTMRLNLNMWWNQRRREGFPEAVRDIIRDVENQRRQLQKALGTEKPTDSSSGTEKPTDINAGSQTNNRHGAVFRAEAGKRLKKHD